MKNEEQILKLYYRDDEFRPKFSKPFFNTDDGNRLWATDAHQIIRVNKNIVEHLYPYESQILTVEIPEETPADAKTVTLDDIEQGMIDVLGDKVVNYMTGSEECSECEGTGKVVADYCSKEGDYYEFEVDCPICDGTGKAFEPYDEEKHKLFAFSENVIISAYSVYILSLTMDLLDVDECKFYPLTNNWLKVGVFVLNKDVQVIMAQCFDGEQVPYQIKTR